MNAALVRGLAACHLRSGKQIRANQSCTRDSNGPIRVQPWKIAFRTVDSRMFFPGLMTRQTPATVHLSAGRFYRPELDALRFFAFLAVLLHHGPSSSGVPEVIKRLGGFGLSMFFLLSAYLITELLVREREQTGTIAIRSFYIRRALRIWPLYFAALAGAMVGSCICPDRFLIDGRGLTAMSLFLANWFSPANLGLLAPVWSISIEEQFYAIWPGVVSLGGETAAFAMSICFISGGLVWLWVFASRGWLLGLDTPVEFVFFAVGSLIALQTRGKAGQGVNGATRAVLLCVGLIVLSVAALGTGVGTSGIAITSRSGLYMGYGGAVIGCAMIFAAALGISNVPRALVYLGKISYGLYMFHWGLLELAKWLTGSLKLDSSSVLNMAVVDGLALSLCVPAAHLSYLYLESPFLRLKTRFEVIASRPA
jgi:peptidoglycan/LPS O-acetylase OafA/YrhL